MIGVFYILSMALGVMGFALLAPATIGLTTGDPAGQVFLIVAGLVGFLAGASFFALQGRRHQLARVHGIVVVVLAWTVLPVAGAIPIALASNVAPVDALFESVSGFTTTGATVFPVLSDISPAVVFWRSELQWLGGLLTLITFVAILTPLGIGGLRARGLAMTGDREATVGRVVQLIGEIALVYALATGLCVLLLSVTGVPPFDAFCLAMSSISTGGFMPVDGDLAVYGSPAADGVVAVFMAVGATSIVWQRLLIAWRRTHLEEHLESVAVIVVMGVTMLAYVVYLAPKFTALETVGEAFFVATSLVSTTGFEIDAGTLHALPGAITVLIALAGGAALSTAGGIKLYRIGAMLVQSTGELHKLVFPNSVRSIRFGHTHDPDIMKAIWANLSLSLFVLATAAVLLSFDLPTIDSVLTAAVAAFVNMGPLYGAAASADAVWPAVADFSLVSKLTMIATMILGRVEVFVFLAIFAIADWRA